MAGDPRTWLASSWLLALLLTAAVARAEPSAADKETARTLYRSGMGKLAKGEADTALDDLRKADLIMGVPTTRTAVGKAQVAVGQLVEGRDTLLSVARIPKEPAEPPPFVQARAEAARLAEEVGQRIPSLRLEVSGVKDSASLQINVDGEAIHPELLSAPRKVNPGKHQVEVAAPGYATQQLTVELDEGEQRELSIQLKPKAAKAMSGDSDSPTPDTGGEGEDAGAYSISPVVWVGVALAGAGLIAGGITGGLAAKRSADLDELCPDKRCDRDDHEADLNNGLILAHVSTASFAVAGAGAGLALIGLFVLSGDDGESEAAVLPVVGPGSLGLRGSF